MVLPFFWKSLGNCLPATESLEAVLDNIGNFVRNAAGQEEYKEMDKKNGTKTSFEKCKARDKTLTIERKETERKATGKGKAKEQKA